MDIYESKWNEKEYIWQYRTNLGHEGNLGVVTEAIIRVCVKPEVQEFGSLVFPNFEIGIKFMEEMAKLKIYPTSLRLVDNIQF